MSNLISISLFMRLSFLLFMFQSLLSCGQNKSYDEMLEKLYKHSVPTIQPKQLNSEYPKNKKILILDAREYEEYKVSHLEKAVYVGYDHLNLKPIEKVDRDVKVVVYCSVGYRSEKVGEKLKEMGFTDVYNLYGGIFEWVNEGYKVVDSNGNEVKQVHAYNKNWGKWVSNENYEKVYK